MREHEFPFMRGTNCESLARWMSIRLRGTGHDDQQLVHDPLTHIVVATVAAHITVHYMVRDVK